MLFEKLEVLRPLDLLKVSSFCPILGPIYPQKTKNLARNKNFSRNCIHCTIKLHKSQVPHKSQNSCKNFQIYKTIFWSQNGLIKVQNGSEIKDQEVRDQDTTQFSKVANPGLTTGEIIFVITCLNRDLCQF